MDHNMPQELCLKDAHKNLEDARMYTYGDATDTFKWISM